MKSIIKDWYTGENIPVETRLPAYRRTARAGAGNGRTERPVHRHFFRSQNELYEALCDREEFAGLHRATAIFAQGVGSACVWLSRLWDEKRKAPVYPGERLPLTNAPNARILLTNLFRWGKTMPDRSFTTANYYYFGYYFTGNGSVCCGTVQDAK